jgi:glycosyltransferase 2 family protein
MSNWWYRNRRFLLQLTGTLLAIFLLFLLLKEEGLDEILAALKTIQLVDLLIVAGFFAISRFATAARWHVLLRSGGVDIHFRDTLSLTFTGLFASNFLPTTIGGDAVRLAGVMQMGFDRAVCLASLAADRLIGMLGMSMATPLGLFYSWNTIFGGTLSAITMPVFLRRILDFLKRTLNSFSLWFKKPGALLLSLLFTWVHMLCLFASIAIFVRDLDTPISFWMIAGLWSLTYFVTLIPISINGLGIQELSFTFLMSNVAGLSAHNSLTVAILIRACFLFSSLPGAAFLPSALANLTRQKTDPPHSDP